MTHIVELLEKGKDHLNVDKLLYTSIGNDIAEQVQCPQLPYWIYYEVLTGCLPLAACTHDNINNYHYWFSNNRTFNSYIYISSQ